MAWLWVVALHALNANRQRPAVSATVASVFLFSHVLYWGFLSFLAGWVTFIVWFLLHDRMPAGRLTWRRAILFFAAGALLYLTHVLWFLFGVGWLVIDGLRRRLGIRELLRRALCLVPIGALAAVWFPSIVNRGFTSNTSWPHPFISRFSPTSFTNAALGGIRGPLEPVMLLGVLLWLGVGIWQRRSEGRAAWDGRLLLLAALSLTAWAILPNKAANTLYFAERWLPGALAVLSLAAPAPRCGPGLRLVPALVLACFVAATTLLWHTAEQTSLTGMDEVIAALPKRPRVLGLSFMQNRVFKADPYLQTFAWAQVARGGELNFSFADFAVALVVYREPRRHDWTLGLEWNPMWVRSADLRFFDAVIVSGDERVHAWAQQALGLEPVTTGGIWRLYRPAPGRRQPWAQPPNG
ncbi:MAG: hypothetical protein BWX64_02402 [Acidobacteria bacterium ADurb.Bin051]|nr:MAG: hypothetical protein BWX64_02402 [Acidobacteria bacterium ADurb.Bin051]